MHYRCTVHTSNFQVVILKFMGLDHTYKVNNYFFLMDKKRSIFIVNFFDQHLGKRPRSQGYDGALPIHGSWGPANLKAEHHQKKIVRLNFHVCLLTFPCLFFWIKLRKSIIMMLLFFLKKYSFCLGRNLGAP